MWLCFAYSLNAAAQRASFCDAKLPRHRWPAQLCPLFGISQRLSSSRQSDNDSKPSRGPDGGLISHLYLVKCKRAPNPQSLTNPSFTIFPPRKKVEDISTSRPINSRSKHHFANLTKTHHNGPNPHHPLTMIGPYPPTTYHRHPYPKVWEKICGQKLTTPNNN